MQATVTCSGVHGRKKHQILKLSLCVCLPSMIHLSCHTCTRPAGASLLTSTLLGTCSKPKDECVSGCADVVGYGAQSVPARMNALTNEDEWEARTMMPGTTPL